MKLPPLPYKEALQCLGCLVTSTALAIESLHDNICLHHDGVAM